MTVVPNFETPKLRVPNLVAEDAFNDVFLGALTRYVPCLVALEAQLLSAVEGVVGVLAAEDAVRATALVRALLGHVSELLAVSAFDRRVRLDVVTSHLVFHFRKHVVFQRRAAVGVLLSARLLHCLVANLAVRRLHFVALVQVEVPPEVHVALKGAAWDYQVWIALRVDSRDVVAAIVSDPLSETLTTGHRLCLAR